MSEGTFRGCGAIGMLLLIVLQMMSMCDDEMMLVLAVVKICVNVRVVLCYASAT